MVLQIREVTLLAVALRVIAAVVIGGLIGLERGLKNRPAGMRTYMVVCLGSCLVMLTNQYIVQFYGTGDSTRMAAQVVSGIGFLGAGTIIVTRRNQIKGLTTAAGLWASACVGLALGVGFYEAAMIGGFAVFGVMTLLQRMDNRMHAKTKALEVYIELARDMPLSDFLRQLQQFNLDARDIQREGPTGSTSGSRAYIISLRAGKRRDMHDIIDDVQSIEGVLYLEHL